MKRGLALILVVGVLGVMAVLGTAFVLLSRLERTAARQRLLSTKASLLARSGLEDAIARVCNGQDPSSKWFRYGGEDWNDDGTFDAFESQQEVFKPGAMNKGDCPVRQAIRPSFFVADPSGAPKYRPMDGRERGWSGGLTETMLYALRVDDESGKINVNGGFLDAVDRDGDGVPDHRDLTVNAPVPPPPIPAFAVKPRGFIPSGILNTLGIELGIATLGNKIVQNRPLGGYASIAQLQTLTGVGATTDLAPYLTLSSWVDRKVIQPQGLSTGPPAGETWAASDVKKNRLPAPLSETGRPPVNLNAAPRPVLVSLLRGLNASSTYEPSGPFTIRGTPSDGTNVQFLNIEIARMVADRFVQQRDLEPFVSWPQFNAFCDSLVPTCLSNFNVNSAMTYLAPWNNQAAADMLKANFNPNTGSNKEMADPIAWRWVDKNDLTAVTTEGSLGPTGSFKLFSVGRILGIHGKVLAQTEASCMLEAFRMHRQTTQRDFVGSRDLWEDPVPEGRYLGLSTSPHRTTGASAGPVWWGGGTPSPSGQGLAVVTYPNPPMVLAASGPSDTDGAIALATVELDRGASENGLLTFAHHFDDSWNADFGASPSRIPGTWDSALQTNIQTALHPAPGTEPNTFYVDGVHIQPFRGIGWNAAPNFPTDVPSGFAPSNHAAFGFWIKSQPSFAMSGGLVLSAIRQFPMQSGYQGDDDTQCLLLGRGGNGWTGWGMLVESRSAIENVNGDERQYAVSKSQSAMMPDLRWQLVTAHFDSDESNLDTDLILNVLGVDPSVNDRIAGQYPFPLDNEFNCTDLFENTVFKFGVEDPSPVFDPPGQEWKLPWNVPQVCHFLLDEFAVCDFTDVGAAAIVSFADWTDWRWKEGRYYKGDDGFFLSNRMRLEDGNPFVLLRARWTAYLPKDGKRLVSPSTAGEPEMMAWTASATVTGIQDPRLLKSRVELELLNEDGTQRLQPLLQDRVVSRRLDGFRYKVRFKTDLRNPDGTPDPGNLNQPALETPIFDDITFYYQKPGGARFLDWGRPGP